MGRTGGGRARCSAAPRARPRTPAWSCRPLPAQPTIRDSVAFQATFAGLLKGLTATDHLLRELDWETASENFYAATRAGLDADLTWIDADGLERRGLSNDEAATYLRPLRGRVDRHVTPASWKRDRVRAHLADGLAFDTAAHEMQRDYLDRQRETLLSTDFASWSDVPA